jgi:hypothetical protein
MGFVGAAALHARIDTGAEVLRLVEAVTRPVFTP